MVFIEKRPVIAKTNRRVKTYSVSNRKASVHIEKCRLINNWTKRDLTESQLEKVSWKRMQISAKWFCWSCSLEFGDQKSYMKHVLEANHQEPTSQRNEPVADKTPIGRLEVWFRGQRKSRFHEDFVSDQTPQSNFRTSSGFPIQAHFLLPGVQGEIQNEQRVHGTSSDDKAPIPQALTETFQMVQGVWKVIAGGQSSN